jgi:hypothetical protein
VLEAVKKPHSLMRLPALLSGPDGGVTRCFVESWKEQSSKGRTYTRCRIVDDPPHLPDGEYVVEFAEQSIRTNKYHGRWELTFFCPDRDITDAA